MIFPLKRAEWEGRMVPVPGNIDQYLEMRYGDITLSKRWDSIQKRWLDVEGHEYNTGAEHSS